MTKSSLCVLELFCGIGGCSAALNGRAEVTAAVDIDRDALTVYRANFPHPSQAKAIESLPASAYCAWRADLWWLSPPCQPYMARGRRRDLDDPRAESFKAALARIDEFRPRYLALENVAGFVDSRAHALLREVLDRRKYRVLERVLCPTELGVPNRRPRFYLVASQDELAPRPAGRMRRRSLADYLEPSPPPETFAPPSLIERFRAAVHLVRPDDPAAVASCFTAAYGKSPVRCGSYLATEEGVRRFTPREVLRLLGFPEQFQLPPKLPLRRGWALAGNSLSVHAVRWALAAIPELRDGEIPSR